MLWLKSQSAGLSLAILLSPWMTTKAMAQVASDQAVSKQDTMVQTTTQLRAKAMQVETAWQIVEGLTTEVGPRMAGSEGDARAVAWMKAKFEALGFDKVWLEPVVFPAWERRHESARIISPYPQPLAITALGASKGTGAKSVRGEIVMFDSIEALKAAPDGAHHDAIVFIRKKMRRSHDGAGYGETVAARSQGAAQAARVGAKALLIRSIGTDDDRLPHTGTGVSRGEVLADPKRVATLPHTHSGLPIVETDVPAAALSNPDADQLERALNRGMPVVVELQLDVGFKGDYTSQNVIAQLNGRDKPEEIVLIGGHLDSWDLGTGAIDDGAGVAITTAAAHLIAGLSERPRRSIRVVAFANEEAGLYGAKAYADAHADELPLHQIAAESDFGADVIYGLATRVAPEALPVVDQLVDALRPLGIERSSKVASGGPDVRYLYMAGVPVAELQQSGDDYFDYHHTANDTLDKIDRKKLQQNVAAYAVFAWMAAEMETRFSDGLMAKPSP